ncbi:hypothetical protein AMTRI_Chr03g44230 [Amborella trichopoda]
MSSYPIFDLLQSCKTVRQLQKLHAHMITTNLTSSITLISKLLAFCICPNSGNLLYANLVFTQIKNPNSFMHNLMIRGHSSSAQPQNSFLYFKQMQKLGLEPNMYTFPFLVKACIEASSIIDGECIHAQILKHGFEDNVFSGSNLIQMYSICGKRIEDSRKVFDGLHERNVVVWTCMISCYVHHGHGAMALELFESMKRSGEAEPSEVTIVHVIEACIIAKDVDMGIWVHDYAMHSKSKLNVVVGSALMDMFSKFGSLNMAKRVFCEMPERNLVSYNTMLNACCRNGKPKETFRLFSEMRLVGLEPDEITLLSLLDAYASVGALCLCQAIHGYLYKRKIDQKFMLYTALINTYSKCGDANEALQVFQEMEERDVLAYSAMITGLAMHGISERAIELFREMDRDHVRPDKIAYVGVLSACSHAGKVEEGREFFDSMSVIHGIEPTLEHYGCMTDLLSRAGHLADALRLIESMPMKPNLMVWSAFLSGCRIHGDVDKAESVVKHIVELNPQSGGVYVLLSNIFAKAGRWRGVEMMRELMRDKRAGKSSGCSAIEINGGFHEFCVGDERTHPQSRRYMLC